MTEAIEKKAVSGASAAPAEKISWADFQREYLSREDEFKYEWVDGSVQKSPITMDKSQGFILKNIQDFFMLLKIANPGIGNLMPEMDNFFDGQHRRPDISFYTDAQILDARHRKKVDNEFVIEVISSNDQINAVGQKLRNYWAAGVKVIWLIYPEFEDVQVYHGKKSVVCTGDDLCSAEPVIKGFVMPAKDIFK